MANVYATLADMLDRFEQAELVQLTDEAGAGVIDQAKVAKALASAAGLIDGYVAARHQLPLTTVPALLVDAACDLARFRLWKSTPPEGVQKAQAAAVKLLEQVSAGKVRLDQGVETEAAREGAIVINDPGRVFSRDTLKGF
jgi:phage gp36-like protein